MKKYIIIAAFTLSVCLKPQNGLSIKHKCHQWNEWPEWPECTNSFVRRFDNSDNSLHERNSCKDCGLWEKWFLCEGGTKPRHLAKYSRILEERKCNNSDKGPKINEEKYEDDINLKSTYDFVKINNKITAPSFVSKKPEDVMVDINVDMKNISPYDARKVIRKIQNKQGETGNETDTETETETETETYEKNMKNFITKKAHASDSKYTSQNFLADTENKSEETNVFEKNFNNTESLLKSRNKKYFPKEKIMMLSPEFPQHKFVEKTVEKPISVVDDAETKIKQEMDFLTHQKDVNFLNKSATETEETSQPKSEDNFENTKSSFDGTYMNTYIACGTGGIIILIGSIGGYAYAKKKKGVEVSTENKNENYEVIFNEDSKNYNDKILYEEEFWGYE